MHLSKALQPGLHIPLGLRKLSVCLKCKGKTSKSKLISKKDPFLKTLIHAVSLFSTERRWKQARNWSLEFQVVRCSLYDLLSKSILQRRETVFESNWIMKLFFSPQDLVFSLANSVRGFFSEILKLSACLSWLSSVPLDESVFNWCVL